MFFVPVRFHHLIASKTKLISLATNVRITLAMAQDSRPFVVEYAPQGRAKCKTCKQQIEKTTARIGKVVSNPFSEDGGLMKQWYHIRCIFDSLSRARSTTTKIKSTNDLDGFDDMKDDDKKIIQDFIGASGSGNTSKSPSKQSPAKKKVQATLPFSPPKGPSSTRTLTTDASSSTLAGSASSSKDLPSTSKQSKDDSFREFRRLCTMLAGEPSYNAKTQIIADFIKKGTSQDQYTGDLYLLAKLLLPSVHKRVFNLQSKQLVKLFSQILGSDLDEMITDLEKGDVAETISDFFESSTKCKPSKKSILTNQEVDEFLDNLTKLSKEDEQIRELTKITRKCTANDLKYIIRLIKRDLRMNTGAKHVLEAIHPSAYEAFQASNDLFGVIKRWLNKQHDTSVPSMDKKLSIQASVMTPVKPMLAEACKSFSQAIKKSPNGMYAEIKYDGERVQVHKSGDKFQFFSRSLKPVVSHKVSTFKEYLPRAFPHGNDLILDSEVLLVDNKTSTPLPFGTLGIHKKSAFKDANVCLFIFDCLQFNDVNLMTKTMQERRQYLEKNVTVIPNRIMLSETTLVKDEKQLSKLMARAMREGLEGLVLKDLKGIYEPGKRHWLKMKKDYLAEGAMADTADLVVLGAYYGTGNKGGLMSIFLMGVYNPHSRMWCTVAKCGNGHDDKTIDRLNKELKMKKISKDPNRVPTWLEIHRSLVPDFVVDDPKKAPVWEITGAEFSKSTVHTANGISIRFPRVTKIRDDKDWQTATDIDHLQTLFKNSRAFTDPKKIAEEDDDCEDDNADDDNDDTVMKCEESSKDEVSPSKKGKRKAANDIDEEDRGTAKKQVCKYGPKCYQTNPEHLKRYLHITAKTEQPGDPSEKLPSLFSGLQMFIPEEMKDYKKLMRYIIAYDGDVVSELCKESASHIIADSKVSHGGKGVVVSADWIWKCIKKNKIVPVKKYLLE